MKTNVRAFGALIRRFSALATCTAIGISFAPQHFGTGVLAATASSTTTKPISIATKTAPYLSLVRQTALGQGDGIYAFDLQVSPQRFRPTTNPIEVAATLHQRVKTRSEFTETLTGRTLGSVLGQVPATVANLFPNQDTTVRVTVPIGPQTAECPTCIAVGDDGVYPIHLELRERGGERIFDDLTTYLIYAKKPSRTPLGVALIVQLNLPLGRSPDGQDLQPSSRAFNALVEGMAARPLVPLTVIPTPETLETLENGANANEQTANPLLGQLRNALSGRLVLSSPFVKWSEKTLRHPILLPEIKAQRSAGDETIRELLQIEPLTDIGIFTEEVPSEAARAALGVQRIVADERALQPPDVVYTPGRLSVLDPGGADGSTAAALPLVVLDSTLGSHLTATISDRPAGSDDVLRGQHLLADLAMLHFDAPNRKAGVAILVPKGTAQATFDTIAAGVSSDVPTFQAQTLSDIFDLPFQTALDGSTVARVARSRSVETPTSTVRDTALLRQKLNGYRSLFDEAPAGTSDVDAQLARSLADGLTDSERRTYLKHVTDDLERRLAAIRISSHRAVTLTGRRQDVSVAVVNDSGAPIRAKLIVTSDKVEFGDGKSPKLALDRRIYQQDLELPQRINQLRVPVVTRGPGSFSMLVRIQSPSGLDLSMTRYTLRSTAVSGLGKLLSVGALGFLALWWSRSILRGRQRKALNSHPAGLPNRRRGNKS